MIVRIIIRILVASIALVVAAHIVPGIHVENVTVVIIAAAVLGVLNLFIKPIVVLLTLPVTIVTLGLFMFVINAGIFLATAHLVHGFSVDGFFPALLGSFVVSIVTALLGRFLP